MRPVGTIGAVFLVLVVAFFVVPIVELALIIKIGAAIGVLNTIGLLILSSVVGGWLMKREGLGVVRRMQLAVAEGRVPGKELVDAFLILFGGALMVAPGFLTDGLGMLLLLPPVRAVVRRILRRRFTVRVLGSGPGSSDIIDV
jgi:UPF0716 protein FxsA